jgi:CheY-like chemotaxis protein
VTPPRILVVDDDAAMRSLVRTAVSGKAWELSEAEDGDLALKRIEEFEPDLVVLDWKMPGRHGALVLDEVKETRPLLPVVVLTAEVRDSQRALAEALHADAFVAKPFSPFELIETIERLLAARAEPS